MDDYLISDVGSESEPEYDSELQPLSSTSSTESISNDDMIRIGSQVTLELLELRNQIKVAHWQSTSYSEHKTLDKLFDILNNQNDRWVETFMGKYDRVHFPTTNNTIRLINKNELDIHKTGIESYLKTWVYKMRNIRDTYFNTSTHSDLSNIFDELFGDIYRTCYLLTLN